MPDKITKKPAFIPALADFHAAGKRLSGHIVETPLFENFYLNKMVNARVLIKPEILQNTGSFKYRGAFNRVAQFTLEQKKSGLITWSSGNHALAIAAVAAKFNVPATILIPQEASQIKIEGARELGATVRLYDPLAENREEIGAEVAARTGAVIVPPYDDPHIITGQGTIGLEMVQQAQHKGIKFDCVLASCSGGGLISGMGAAIKAVSEETSIYCVEPVGFDSTIRSFNAKKRLKNAKKANTICDALMVSTPGKITFPIMQKILTGGVSVSDDEVRTAMKFAFKRMKLVLEPGGAAALAAVISGKLSIAGKVIGLVLSGGNVDLKSFASWIND